MMRETESKTVRQSAKWFSIGSVVALLGILLWWFSPSETQLDDNGYATTLALYRVCNQQNSDGLAQIEALLNPDQTELASSDKGRTAIEAIISQAKRNRWQEAARDCRRLLESQVKR